MILDLMPFMAARYEKGGRGPAAYDCFGLFIALNRALGRDIPEHDSPEAIPERDAAIAAGILADGWRELAAPQPGCAVTFIIRAPYVSHIGLVLEDGFHFVHIQASGGGVSVERLDSPLWAHRIKGYYSWN